MASNIHEELASIIREVLLKQITEVVQSEVKAAFADVKTAFANVKTTYAEVKTTFADVKTVFRSPPSPLDADNELEAPPIPNSTTSIVLDKRATGSIPSSASVLSLASASYFPLPHDRQPASMFGPRLHSQALSLSGPRQQLRADPPSTRIALIQQGGYFFNKLELRLLHRPPPKPPP